MDREEKIEMMLKLVTQYIKDWLHLLCNTDELLDLFANEYLDVKCLWISIAGFQSYLKSAGRGRDITAEQLQDCVNRRDDRQLKALLEELLLIPIDGETLRTIKQKSMVKLVQGCNKYSGLGVIQFSKDGLTFMAN